jgi:YVTN family beta-propeller protein/VCBS repeat-containing protein
LLSEEGWAEMSHSGHIGRVGALAVALGVGAAIGAPGGLAWASPTDGTTSSPSADTEDSGTSTGGSTGTTTDSGQPTSETTDGGGRTEPSASQGGQPQGGQSAGTSSSSTVEVAPGVTVSNSGGAHTSTASDERGSSGGHKSARPQSRTRTVGTKKTAAADTQATAQTNTADESESKIATTATTATQSVAASARTAAVTATAPIDVTEINLTATQPVSAKPIPSPVTLLLTSIVRPILSSFLGALPTLPTNSPLAWVYLAAARRQIGMTEPETTPVTTLAVTTALVENQPPTVTTVIDTPVVVTGAVSGQLVGTDPEGQPVSYTLTTRPTTGTLVFDSATAKFTYTPTTLQRITAGLTPTTDTIAMTVTVSDGTSSVPTVVNIPIAPAPIAKLAEIGAADDAHAVVVTATRAYVTNRTAGTVTVIDTASNTVIGTIAVGPTPDALVINPTGTKLYVTSLDNNTVNVVDTTTKAITKTFTVAKPSAIAMSSSGNAVYVSSLDAGTVTKISTSTLTVSGTVKLPTGYRPTGLVVTSDGQKIYVISTKPGGIGSVDVFQYAATSTVPVTGLTGTPTALAISKDNKRLYVSSNDGKITVIDTATKTVVATHTLGGELAAVAVSTDGSTLLVTDTVGRVSFLNAVTGALLTSVATRTSTAAMSVAPGMKLSPDGTRLYVTDYDADRVYVVSMLPPNNAPTAGTATINPPNATTGAITGSIGVTDVDRDVLTYTVVTKPPKGTLVLTANGTFTYTPTATARHAASAVNAPLSAKTDSFTVSVSDGRGGVVSRTLTVNILPANKVPTYTLTVGTPNSATGVVTGKVTASDADYDAKTFSASTPTKGAVVVTSTGSFTYTPTAQARHAAARLDATTADKQDTFTITINDGHGGVVPVTVTVAISPVNSAPTNGAVTNMVTNLNSGVVTGTVKATDANSDPLSYTATAPTKGLLVFGSNGAFTYTPTTAARQAASSPTATPDTKIDVVTVTVADGYGGTTTVTLNLPVTPYSSGHAVVGEPNSAIGEVKGALIPDGLQGTITYTVTGLPSKGVVNVDSSGAFRYVPNVEARWGAKVTPGVDTDSFAVTATGGNGESMTIAVSVTIAPPSTASSAIDQRGTTVAVNVQEMYFYSQADTDRALDLLKADGVNTIRIMIPWAGVESANDVWNWSAVDRMVNSAVARDMQVQAFLNSTPGWAVVPGTPALGGPPADPQEFAEFVSIAASRYAGKIAAYEVWNEPNFYQFWQPTPDAAAYTALLKVAYTAIKAADPNAVVIGGVIAAAPDSGTQAVNSVRFLTEMYQAGAAGYFDALSYHPYHYYVKFSQGLPYPTSPLTLANQMHAVMVANGDGNKKIWATEYGEPSAYSTATQAAFTDDFLSTWRDLDYAGPAFIHTIRDYVSADPTTASFGIYTQNWTAKPVVGVIEAIIDENEAFLAGGGGIEL